MTRKNRIVVITGATGGLGRVVARRMTEEGARLALLGRSTERLEHLASELGLTEDRYLTHQVNLSSAQLVESAAQAVFSLLWKNSFAHKSRLQLDRWQIDGRGWFH